MAQRPKAKPKRKDQKSIKGADKKQSERFIETARKLEIESTSSKDFERAFSKVISSKKKT